MKLYEAIIWDPDPNVPGQRVSVMATDLADARSKLEAEYGKDRTISLRNEADSTRIR